MRLYHGDATEVMGRMPERSFQCCVTSPPYWGQRDYGVKGQIGCEPSPDCGTHGQAQCGACFVCAMVRVFRGVRRVLRDDGVLWLNLGDTYNAYNGGRGKSFSLSARVNGEIQDLPKGHGLIAKGLKQKDLVGVPWRTALALQHDGWYLRSDVIWMKPSPHPESPGDRCTRAHEFVFMLTKQTEYFYDDYAISTKLKGEKGFPPPEDGRANRRDVWTVDHERGLTDWVVENHPELYSQYLLDAENRSDVWRVPYFRYPGAHFACFPPRLVEPCVKAGSSETGCCSSCGAPRRRITERRKLMRPRPHRNVKRTGERGTGNSCPNTMAGVGIKTVGWEWTCRCSDHEPTETVPCTVLDPFIGSGTTAEVCLDLGRRCVGTDLNEEYLKFNAIPRVEGALSRTPALTRLVPSKSLGRINLPGRVVTGG